MNTETKGMTDQEWSRAEALRLKRNAKARARRQKVRAAEVDKIVTAWRAKVSE